MKTIFQTIVGPVLLLSFAPTGFAATATVGVGSGLSNVFIPATTNIAVGDRVIWNWGGNFHSTTSGTTSGLNAFPDGLWDSGLANAPHSFTNTFNSSGTFPYYCSQHFTSGMKGSIIVASVNQPPTVSISSPTNNSIFAAPAGVTIQATAVDADGSITNVQILAGTTVLTNQTAAPFFATTNNLPAGGYSLTAVATDNGGLKATNTVTISVVNPVAVIVSAPQWLPPANFQFSYTANIGLRYVVQRATDLGSANWTALITNTAASNPVVFTDPNAAANNGFYRVGRMPNP